MDYSTIGFVGGENILEFAVWRQHDNSVTPSRFLDAVITEGYIKIIGRSVILPRLTDPVFPVHKGQDGRRTVFSGCKPHMTVVLCPQHDGMGGVWSLRNLTISVPRAVLSGEGQSAVLRCSYDLEDAALYSIRWYRAETEFYRYVPREMPPTMVFPLPGAFVDLTQSDHQQVRIVNLNSRLSGDYQCEVSADAPLFHTEIRNAPLTVVDPPFRAPELTISRGSYARGDVLRANCSVDEAYPTPNITWTLDNHKIAETISKRTSEFDFKERPAFSRLEISILEAEHYKMGLTYTSASLKSTYHDSYYTYDRQTDNDDNEIFSYTLVPPAAGQFTLGCVATIYDIYERKSNPVLIKEDAPHPASVTGEDSAGSLTAYNALLTSVCAGAAFLYEL